MSEGAHIQREKTLVDMTEASGSNSSLSTTRGQGGQGEGGFKRVARIDTFDPEGVLPVIESDYPLLPARNPPVTTIFDHVPLLRFFRWIWKVVTLQKMMNKLEQDESKRVKRRKAYADIVESHIPLEICLVLSNYSACELLSFFPHIILTL